MSIIAANIGAARALVVTDTEGITENGEKFDVSKSVVVPHLGAVAFFRGYAATVGGVAFSLPAFPGTFDDLATAMPQILANAQQAAQVQFLYTTKGKPPIDFTDVEVLLVGHSQQNDRITAHVYKSKDSKKTFSFEHHTDVKTCLAPGVPIPDGVGGEMNGLLTLAQAQCDLIKADYPGKAAGGRFLAFEITKSGVSFAEVGRYALGDVS